MIGNFRHTGSLRNLKDPEIQIHSEEEKKWLQPFQIPLKIFEVNSDTTLKEMQKIVNEVKSLPKPTFMVFLLMIKKSSFLRIPTQTT